MCKFLCGDQKDENSGEVKVKLHIDSSAAMGTIQRAGFGRMKHLQIRHLFLQDLLRMKVFSLHKISTKMNPADLGTKKLGLERRKDLGRLIGIFTGEDETSRRTEVLQTRRVRVVLMTAFQAAAASLLQGCSSPSSFLSGQPSTSPTSTSMAEIRSGMVLGGVLMLMMGMLVMMVPGAASRSRSRDDPQPEYASVQQWTSEMRNFLATTFVLSAKAYWFDGQHDQFSIENMFNHLRLAALLMKNDEKEAVEYFITAVEVNDPEEIMAQVRNMRMCMDLPHVNLLHAEAWLWEEFRDDLQRKADASDGAFFVPIVELLKHRWDTPPGESDRGGDEDAASSRRSIANRSGDENVRESPAREFELRMTMNLPRSEAIQVAQTIADAHGRELVVERPAGSDEREHGDRDGQEPEPGSSNSENTTLNSRTTLNTTEEENDKIEQAMAEARASLRRGIRVLQSRATRYEELGDHEAAEEARRQIDDMEAMESSI